MLLLHKRLCIIRLCDAAMLTNLQPSSCFVVALLGLLHGISCFAASYLVHVVHMHDIAICWGKIQTSSASYQTKTNPSPEFIFDL